MVGLVLLLELGVATSGCSVLFVDGPPPRPRRPDFDCTSAYGVPALDTGIALLALGILAMRGSAITNGLTPHDGFLLGFSATFLVSAIDGYQQVYSCREALEETAPPPETPQHHRPPPIAPASTGVTTPSAPPVPQQPDSFDAP